MDFVSLRIFHVKKGIKPQYLNFDLRQLNPHKYCAAYHFHRYAEEIFLILSGSATLRTSDGLEEVYEGDIMFFEAGEATHTNFIIIPINFVLILIYVHNIGGHFVASIGSSVVQIAVVNTGIQDVDFNLVFTQGMTREFIGYELAFCFEYGKTFGLDSSDILSVCREEVATQNGGYHKNYFLHISYIFSIFLFFRNDFVQAGYGIQCARITYVRKQLGNGSQQGGLVIAHVHIARYVSLHLRFATAH